MNSSITTKTSSKTLYDRLSGQSPIELQKTVKLHTGLFHNSSRNDDVSTTSTDTMNDQHNQDVLKKSSDFNIVKTISPITSSIQSQTITSSSQQKPFLERSQQLTSSSQQKPSILGKSLQKTSPLLSDSQKLELSFNQPSNLSQTYKLDFDKSMLSKYPDQIPKNVSVSINNLQNEESDGFEYLSDKLYEHITPDKFTDFIIKDEQKSTIYKRLEETIGSVKENICRNIQNHDFKMIVNRTNLHIIYHLHKYNIKYSLCGAKAYLNLLADGGLHIVKKIKQYDPEFVRTLSPLEWNILSLDNDTKKYITKIAEKAFNLYLKNEYNKIKINIDEDNDLCSIISTDDPKINLLTILSSPYANKNKLSFSNKNLTYILLLINFAINNILNKTYYCRLISLCTHEKTKFYAIFNNLKYILHGNNDDDVFKLSDYDYYYDINGVVYMGLYNSLFMLTQQLCNEYSLNINDGLCNIILELIKKNTFGPNNLFTLNVFPENYHMTIQDYNNDDFHPFDSHLFNNIESVILSKLNDMMLSNNEIKDIPFLNTCEFKSDISLILTFNGVSENIKSLQITKNSSVLQQLTPISQGTISDLQHKIPPNSQQGTISTPPQNDIMSSVKSTFQSITKSLFSSQESKNDTATNASASASASASSSARTNTGSASTSETDMSPTSSGYGSDHKKNKKL